MRFSSLCGELIFNCSLDFMGSFSTSILISSGPLGSFSLLWSFKSPMRSLSLFRDLTDTFSSCFNESVCFSVSKFSSPLLFMSSGALLPKLSNASSSSGFAWMSVFRSVVSSNSSSSLSEPGCPYLLSNPSSTPTSGCFLVVFRPKAVPFVS